MPTYGPGHPHPLSTLRGEFVWEGKYDVHGRRREPGLPDPPPEPELIEAWGPTGDPDGAAPNLLLAGDNRLALAALLPEFRGQVQLIYIDPPFDTGTDHTMRVPVGNGNGHRARNGDDRQTSRRRLEVVAYRDSWGQGAESYLHMMYERLCLMRELLRDTGVLCVHCDWRSHAGLRLVLDEVFGPECFLNEIVWHYYNKYSAGTRHLPRAHDSILMYARGPRPALNPLRLPREDPRRQLVRENVDGVLRNARDSDGRLRYRTVHDRKGDDVWRIPQLQPASREWSGYSTQKHHELLRRVMALASREGDLVADFFCGAGTTLAVAEQMGRRWIGGDLGAMAVHSTRKRLLRARSDANGEAPPPFRVATLGPAARREWFAREFGSDAAACRRAVLTAFGAEPASLSNGGPHGWLAEGSGRAAACLLPELDGPCTAEHALAALRTAKAAGTATVYLLAWRFDPRLRTALEALAAGDGERGPSLVPVLVPDALVTPAGSAPPVFRTLPRVQAHVEGNANRLRGTLTVAMRGYEPGPLRPAWGKAWASPPDDGGDPLALLDGWALDPAWRPGHAFRHRWWSFRTPHDRALAPQSGSVPATAVRFGAQPCVLTADVWGLTTLHALEAPARPSRPKARHGQRHGSRS